MSLLQQQSLVEKVKAVQELGKVYIVNFAKNARSQVTQARVQTIHT